jgi:maltokinase
VHRESLISALAESLPGWLPEQRWFGGKDQPIDAVRPTRMVELLAGDPALVLVLVEVEQRGRSQRYQLLVGERSEPSELPSSSWIDGQCYEASADHELVGFLLRAIAEEHAPDGVRFHREPDTELAAGLRGRLITSEQSNTSVVFGERYILKLFRKLVPGPNDDLTLHQALWSVGCAHIARPLGWYEDTEGDRPTLGLLQQYAPDAVDGWAMASTSVRDLMAEMDLHPDEVGGDFAGEAHRLGTAVAAVHADLARALGTRPAEPADLTAEVELMRRRLDEVLAAVPRVAPYVPALRAAFDQAEDAGTGLELQHVHGDLHLGQVLRTVAGWLMIDFEGEPATAHDDRGALRSPLRDVAGMLRSFDYAAHQMLVGQPENRQLRMRAVEWSRRNRDAFCDGYAESSTTGDPRAHADLLRAFELAKAVYEVGYEHANRPEWLDIPLSSIARIASQ